MIDILYFPEQSLDLKHIKKDTNFDKYTYNDQSDQQDLKFSPNKNNLETKTENSLIPILNLQNITQLNYQSNLNANKKSFRFISYNAI